MRRITRRRFLSGAGVLVAAGVTGGVLESAAHPGERERVLHRLGLASSPDHHVRDSHAVEVSGQLLSHHTRSAMGWTISTPGDRQPARAVVVCLHGKGGDHRMAFDGIHVPDVAASLGLPLAVAAVDGGRDSYWHRRADGTDALAMLLDEFLPLVRAHLGVLPQAVMGWSMGGYGALLAGERSNQFRAVAPASPAIWLTPGATAPGAFDSPTDFYANDVFRGVTELRSLSVAVACGTGDPFYAATRELVSEMDFPHRAFFGPGFHDNAFWRSAAPLQLRAIAPTLDVTPMQAGRGS